LVIPDTTLYQVPTRATRGPAPTAGQDSRPRARQPALLQEDIQDIRERGIPRRDSPARDRRISIVEEDFRITHQTRTCIPDMVPDMVLE